MIEVINPLAHLPIAIIHEDKKVSVVDLLLAFGWAKSRGEAKRLIKQGSVRIGHA